MAGFDVAAACKTIRARLLSRAREARARRNDRVRSLLITRRDETGASERASEYKLERRF
jgi:hypothetical protein